MSHVSYDGPMLLDDKHYNSIESGFDPTIFEMDRNYVLVDHEKPVLSDRYIVEFVHDATENYYERGKYGYWSFHVTKAPIFMLFYLPMLNALCFMYLFSCKMPMHRKWVRLKYVWYLFLDALFCQLLFLLEHQNHCA